jgi:hypothetical protein
VQDSSPGAIVRFFNSTDDAKSLKKHMSNLDEIIRGAAVSLLAPFMTAAAAHNTSYHSLIFALILLND